MIKKCVYLGLQDEMEIRWGDNDDPRGLLESGETYTIMLEEAHTWHTHVYLQEFPGKAFNSIWFKESKEGEG